MEFQSESKMLVTMLYLWTLIVLRENPQKQMKDICFWDLEKDIKNLKEGGKKLIENGFSVHIPEKRTAKLYFYKTV